MSTTIEVKRDDKYGLRLLQRAAADEKSAAINYAKYVEWAHSSEVPVEVIAEQLMSIGGHGWSKLERATKAAKAILLLGTPEHRESLDKLYAGQVNLFIAVAEVTPSLPPGATTPEKRTDNERSARLDAERAIKKIQAEHGEWNEADVLKWLKAIIAALRR